MATGPDVMYEEGRMRRGMKEEERGREEWREERGERKRRKRRRGREGKRERQGEECVSCSL